MRLSLRLKALILFALLAVVPVAIALTLLLPGYGATVRENEERAQVIAVSEVHALVERKVSDALDDAATLANALSVVASQDPAIAEAVVRSVLASRPSIDVARLEVPSRNVSIAFAKAGADQSSAPKGTAEQQAEAMKDGSSFDLTAEGQGLLVVPVPRKDPTTPQGFISVPIYLDALTQDLKDAAIRRDLNDSALVVVDKRWRVVAQVHADHLKRGSDAHGLPVWKPIKGPIPADRALAVKSEYEDGETMISVAHTVPGIRWAVGLWRPKASVLKSYSRVRKLALWIGLGALGFALLMGVVSSATVVRPVLRLAQQAKLIGARKWSELKSPSGRNDELGDLENSVESMANDLRSGEEEIARQARLRTDLGRFMSKELVDAIVEGKHPLELGGQRKSVSVLFADLVAFTPIAESREPEEVVTMLNELFSVLTEVVFRHKGTVDKFIGDSLMAVWGAPVHDPDHARHAVLAAEDMMRFLEVGAEDWREKYGVEIRLAVGINSGEAIVGNIGSDKRMEYTVIGDVVNVAARLENVAAPNQVLLSEDTHALCHEYFEMRLMGERKLTGRTHVTKVYELDTE